MKKTNFLLLSVFLFFLSISVVSCSNDDGVDLETPKYESASGKYIISSVGSPYSSIELGASGDYIVIMNNGVAGRAGNDETRISLFGMKGNESSFMSRATNYNGIIYGKYEQLDNGRFDLEGFGIIEIIYGNNEEVNAISITPDNGREIEFDVVKEHVVDDDKLTNYLCRTWKVDKIRDVYYKDKEVVFEKEYVEKEDVRIDEVFFSKSGTYMLVYLDGTIGVSSWKWKNKEDKTISYSWDNNWSDKHVVDISFEGNTLVVREVLDAEGEGAEHFDINEIFTYLSEK